jgi:hypothetical protein
MAAAKCGHFYLPLHQLQQSATRYLYGIKQTASLYATTTHQTNKDNKTRK